MPDPRRKNSASSAQQEGAAAAAAGAPARSWAIRGPHPRETGKHAAKKKLHLHDVHDVQDVLDLRLLFSSLCDFVGCSLEPLSSRLPAVAFLAIRDGSEYVFEPRGTRSKAPDHAWCARTKDYSDFDFDFASIASNNNNNNNNIVASARARRRFTANKALEGICRPSLWRV